MTSPARRSSRRRFLKEAGAGVALFNFVPAHVLGRAGEPAPSEKLGVACIGVGGRGRASVRACAGENLIGLCDVDDQRAAETYEQFPGAKRFRDFRKMLDALDKDVDAVTIGTPDHTHAVAALDAMRRGKHVYCEKPLAHSVHEIRALMQAARENKVVTQLGNQGHSFDDIRGFCEAIWDGAIGEVKEIHAFCSAFKDVYCQIAKLPELTKKVDVPAGLDYDLWLGPAQFRPYSPLWVPWNWRGWMPFGTGCIGDFFCHAVDPSSWALDLGLPESVRAEVDPGYDPEKHADVYPPGTKITFEFAAKGERGPVRLVWFDGTTRPPRPKELESDAKVPGTGAFIYGDKGTILHQSHGAAKWAIIPQQKMKAYKTPAETIPRVKDHHTDWLNAIRSGGQAGSHFGYGGPLTETALLGAIAIRFPGRELKWDAMQMRFTNLDEANALVAPPYRQGWRL